MTRILIAAFLFLSLCLASPILGRQDDQQQADQRSQQEQAETEIREDFYEQISELMKDGEIAEAAALIDRASERLIEEGDMAPASLEDIQRTRQMVASGYARIQNPRAAFEQFRKLLDLQLANIEDENSQQQLMTTVVGMNSFAQRIRKQKEFVLDLDRTVKVLSELTNYDSITPILSRLSVIKAMQSELLIPLDRRQEAIDMLTDELKKVTGLFEKFPDDVISSQLVARTKFHLMRAQSDSAEENKQFDDLQEFINEQLEAHPGDTTLTIQFVSAVFYKVGQIMKEDPETAKALIVAATEKIKAAVEAKPRSRRAYAQIARRLASYESRVNSELKIKQLIGQDAPEFDVEFWVNGDELSEADLRGKVVMLDFWAIWCGPCIRTFPELRRLHDEYADQGLQIIGVTRHYGYEWDEDKDGPRRATRPRDKEDQTEPDPEIENDVIERFLAIHELRYPSIVTPKRSDMQSQFGVVGIPHVVLIDKQGKVQLIKVGGSKENAESIEKKIQELLADD